MYQTKSWSFLGSILLFISLLLQGSSFSYTVSHVEISSSCLPWSWNMLLRCSDQWAFGYKPLDSSDFFPKWIFGTNVCFLNVCLLFNVYFLNFTFNNWEKLFNWILSCATHVCHHLHFFNYQLFNFLHTRKLLILF